MYPCTDPCFLQIFAALLADALCGNSDNVIIKKQLFNYFFDHHSGPALLYFFIFFIQWSSSLLWDIMDVVIRWTCCESSVHIWLFSTKKHETILFHVTAYSIPVCKGYNKWLFSLLINLLIIFSTVCSVKHLKIMNNANPNSPEYKLTHLNCLLYWTISPKYSVNCQRISIS